MTDSELNWAEGMEGVYSISIGENIQVSVVDWPEFGHATVLLYNRDNSCELFSVRKRQGFFGDTAFEDAKECGLAWLAWLQEEVKDEETNYDCD